MLPIVDLHCHYVSGVPTAEQDFRNLVASDEIHRVAVCALDLKLTPSEAFPYMSSFATTNEQLADLIKKIASPKLVPWCHIDPLAPNAAQEARYWLTQRGMKGIKMYPPMGWYPDDERAMPVYEVAASLNVPVLLHMGRVAPHPQLRSKFARPICLEEVGLAFPKIKLIIGHWANMWRWEAFHVAMSFENFFFDLTTSGSLHIPIIRETIEHSGLGIRRIIMGTDGCGDNNVLLVHRTVERLRRLAGLTDEQIDTIVHRNGMAVLGEV